MVFRILGWLAKAAFWFNGLLLLASLFSPYINPAEWWLPAFAGLFFKIFAFADILLLVLFIFAGNWRYSIFALLLAAAMLPALRWNIALYPNKKLGESHKLRILTYNIEGISFCSKAKKVRALALIQHIAALHPDIVFLQEYTQVRYCQHLADSLQKKAGLRYFYSDFGFSYLNQGPVLGAGQLILSRYPLFHFNDILRVKAASNGAFSMEMKYGKDTIALLNVHLQSIGLTSQELNEPATLDRSRWRMTKRSMLKIKNAFEQRGRQTVAVKSAVSRMKHPLILAGDFNDTPLSYTYYTLRQDMQDMFLNGGFGLGSTYAGTLPLLRIDYIMASPVFKAGKSMVLHWPESDHYAVMADISLR